MFIKINTLGQKFRNNHQLYYLGKKWWLFRLLFKEMRFH